MHQKQRGRVSGSEGVPFIYGYDSESIRGFKPKEIRQTIFFVAGLESGGPSANAWAKRWERPLFSRA